MSSNTNMKCEMCKKDIETIFMGKILGTFLKDDKGKKHSICFECQKKSNNDKAKIAEKLNIHIK
jgi:hypothetical protein